MADSSTQSLRMSAPPDRIMDVIADFTAYPAWTGAVKQVEITDPGDGARARRVRFKLESGVVADRYELQYDWAPDGLAVSWDLVSGQVQKAQHGSYQLQPSKDGTLVTYSLTVALNIPLIGLLRRRAERTIMDTALTELRRRVELVG